MKYSDYDRPKEDEGPFCYVQERKQTDVEFLASRIKFALQATSWIVFGVPVLIILYCLSK